MIPKFTPGQNVAVGGGAIAGEVERVIFARGMSQPLYFIEWWDNGEVKGREFLEEQVTAE